MCLEFSRVPLQPLQKVYDWYSFNVIPTIGQVKRETLDLTVSNFFIFAGGISPPTILQPLLTFVLAKIMSSHGTAVI